MRHYEIHSIEFSKGAKVAFLEGKLQSPDTVIIEPYVKGEHIKTLTVEDWMFKKGDK